MAMTLSHSQQRSLTESMSFRRTSGASFGTSVTVKAGFKMDAIICKATTDISISKDVLYVEASFFLWGDTVGPNQI